MDVWLSSWVQVSISNRGINVWLSSDFLMDIWLSSDLLMDIRFSSNLGINVWLSSDFLMDVWLSSWVQVSISKRGIINSGIDSANWGSSIGYWGSSIGSWGSSNSGNWSSSCVSIGIWVSIAIVGSWDNSSRG